MIIPICEYDDPLAINGPCPSAILLVLTESTIHARKVPLKKEKAIALNISAITARKMEIPICGKK
jgi:hypothetical protein